MDARIRGRKRGKGSFLLKVKKKLGRKKRGGEDTPYLHRERKKKREELITFIRLIATLSLGKKGRKILQFNYLEREGEGRDIFL